MLSKLGEFKQHVITTEEEDTFVSAINTYSKMHCLVHPLPFLKRLQKRGEKQMIFDS